MEGMGGSWSDDGRSKPRSAERESLHSMKAGVLAERPDRLRALGWRPRFASLEKGPRDISEKTP